MGFFSDVTAGGLIGLATSIFAGKKKTSTPATTTYAAAPTGKTNIWPIVGIAAGAIFLFMMIFTMKK